MKSPPPPAQLTVHDAVTGHTPPPGPMANLMAAAEHAERMGFPFDWASKWVRAQATGDSDAISILALLGAGVLVELAKADARRGASA